MVLGSLAPRAAFPAFRGDKELEGYVIQAERNRRPLTKGSLNIGSLKGE